ncbi:MAG: SDR family oxidoreductase [Cypionkella sp.]|uniref:SDR family oxidoreductase n=1 Tax=Cypionkella sp. TaxID=2811411 RepID=UPI002ABC6BBA|nr:SDR family oxidoreductase [Cypionkella sp.]MDZ4309374.1 SDR family oxidoreductase [Cypionkella sp.]
MKTLLSLGHGYSAAALAARLIPQGWRVIGTTREADRIAALRDQGVEALLWPCEIGAALDQATHILASAAPDGSGDPFLHACRDQIMAARPEWVGYLSTTAVYGDHQGGWVDETTPVNPQSARAVARVLAERQWLASGLPVQVFRLAGIYGPGRGPFEKVRDGTARRVIKANQVFSRIHVEDIAATLLGSILHPDPGAIYNVCDDNPAPPEDVLTYAAALLGLPEPPTVRFEEAKMTPMQVSFYSESKRVRNDRIKRDLGVKLAYPTYQDGLRGLLR